MGNNLLSKLMSIENKSFKALTCDIIETGDKAISESLLEALNPWIGTGNCTTGLLSGLTSDAARAVCIASNSMIPVASSSLHVSTQVIITTTATSTAFVAGSTTISLVMEPGYTSSCDQYYKVVSGDSCYSIAQSYGITLAESYSWNPDVGDDCASL